MKRKLVAVAVLLLSFASAAAAQDKQPAAKPAPPPIEARVRKLWEAYKSKDKTTLSGMIDGDFRQFEEGLSAFGDKKTEVNSVDDFELINYTLSDFNVKSIGPNAALVTYIAQYEGKSGGEVSKAKSAFGEVWIRAGGDALVTYIAQYEGKSGGEVSKAKSAFGEVWIRAGGEWKDLYMQETYVK